MCEIILPFGAGKASVAVLFPVMDNALQEKYGPCCRILRKAPGTVRGLENLTSEEQLKDLVWLSLIQSLETEQPALKS